MIEYESLWWKFFSAGNNVKARHEWSWENDRRPTCEHCGHELDDFDEIGVERFDASSMDDAVSTKAKELATLCRAGFAPMPMNATLSIFETENINEHWHYAIDINERGDYRFARTSNVAPQVTIDANGG